MKRHLIAALMIITAFLNTVSPAQANFGGVIDTGDQRVLALLTSGGVIDGVRAYSQVCSGSMITPQIVVAAAHCLGNPDHTYTSEVYTPDNLYVSQPGADLDTQNPSDPVKVMRVILTAGYNNSFHPEVGNYITQKDDIAFYFLARPLVANYEVPIATASDVAQIKSQRLMITHVGYGLHGVNEHDGIPRLVQLQAFQQGSAHYGNNPARDDYTIASEETGDKALCPGDSGSPWYATVDGVEKLTAVLVSASGCRVGSDQKGGTMGTLIWPYLDLMNSHWAQFEADLPTLLANDSSVVDMSLPYIERDGGCDAFVTAWLQIQNSDGTWSDFKEAQGWKTIPSCPITNPYHPWVRALVPDGTTIRWKIVAPDNSWTFLTTPYVYTQPPVVTATPTPVPLPMPSDTFNNGNSLTATSNQSVLPTPQASTSSGHSNTAKIKTIYCVKGKKSVSIKGITPVCPRVTLSKSNAAVIKGKLSN